jgi:hypothetical protein
LELNSAMNFKSFLESNFDSNKLPSLVLDSLTMYDDEDFFSSLKANENIPPYMNDLEKYLV